MLQPLIRPPVTLPDGPPQAAQGASAEPKVLATDGLAALSASVVNAALGERLAELSLSGQFPHSHLSSGLINAVAELLQIQQQEGETLESYGERILASLKDLSPQEQLKLQARLDSLIKGLSLSLLRALLVDPQGPSATRLAFMLELQTNGGLRDAASQITSTYQETELADEFLPSVPRDPAMQGPLRAPMTAQTARPAPFMPVANAASNAVSANPAASSSRTSASGEVAVPSTLLQPINDDVAPASSAPRLQTSTVPLPEAASRPDGQRGAGTMTTFTGTALRQQEATTQDHESGPAAAVDGRAPILTRTEEDAAPVRQAAQPADAELENQPIAARQNTHQPEETHSSPRQTATREPSVPAERNSQILGPEAEVRLVALKAQADLLEALEHVTSLQMAEDEPEGARETPFAEHEGTAPKGAPESEAAAPILNADPALVAQKYAPNLHQQVVDDGSAFTGLAQALLQMPVAIREGIMPAYVLYPGAPDGAGESEDRVQPVEPEDEDRHSKGGNHSRGGQTGHQQQEQQENPTGEAEAALTDAIGEPQTTSRAEDYYLRFADI